MSNVPTFFVNSKIICPIFASYVFYSYFVFFSDVNFIFSNGSFLRLHNNHNDLTTAVQTTVGFEWSLMQPHGTLSLPVFNLAPCIPRCRVILLIQSTSPELAGYFCDITPCFYLHILRILECFKCF